MKVFTGNELAMFLSPCLLGACFIGLFAALLKDRRLDPDRKPPWSLSEFGRTFYVKPRGNPDFGWVFTSKFLFVTAYAFLTTYEAYYLLDHLGSPEDDVPTQIFVATLLQSCVVIVASLVGGAASDRTGRRKVFVFAAAGIFGTAMVALALATELNVFFAGVAISGLGLGLYVAVDLALVVDVLPDANSVAKDLGVFNIAGALPYSLAPAVAPAVLALGGYSTLFGAAALCAFASAAAVLPVGLVR